ncbi:hypothetical protein BKA60DRAFT_634287 [Fusarium oxysporum]|uniref:Uncharacterized protein n=1 Tax=Fusarium oxysporum TaxID=5507 RepID=A0A420MK59_FUSOX|nr:hypothetical protein BKA60DRAFT_634287 [Fusarium oxysporum]RKK68397.1 hypothetical protein BFJ69_g13641 [Fusarium oxysporum]
MHHAVELLLCVKAASDFAGVARGLTRWLHAVINHIIWQLPNVYATCETWSDLPELETDGAQDILLHFLVALPRALLAQQKEQDIGESQVADNTEESNKAEEDGDLLMASSPIASTASNTSIPVFNNPSQQAPTADQEPLIIADNN